MNRWESCNEVMLANADNYYTKSQTDELIEGISGMTPEQVQEQIDDSIASKADKSELNELAQQVIQNTEAIIDRYTKPEINAMFANYANVVGTKLILN